MCAKSSHDVQTEHNDLWVIVLEAVSQVVLFGIRGHLTLALLSRYPLRSDSRSSCLRYIQSLAT